jgi:cytidine deaminase
VIATKDGDIVAVGANDVPKAGGGLYWSEDAPDRRDYALGYDTSSKRKKQMLVDVIERLKKNDWLDDDKKTLSLEQLYAESLPIMGDAQLMSVGEFGRSVHAEMAALSDAARRGVPVQSGTLYTTTFPCHNCAKHIVASGIKRVVYIEPYAKSLAAGFYEDSILVDGPRGDDRRVSFEPFVGVAPRQYMDLFAMVKRKDAEGKPVRWDPSKASPRIVASAEVYLAKENQILAEVTRLMNEKCFSKTRTKGKGRK